MSDKKSPPETSVPDIFSHLPADFHQVPTPNKIFPISDEFDPKMESVYPLKTMDFKGFNGMNLDTSELIPTRIDAPHVLPGLEVKDIKSDPELIGFWLQGRSPRTVESYRLELKRFFAFTGGMKFKGLTVSLLFSYADALKIELSSSAQALALASVKSLLSFGFKVGYLEKTLEPF